LTTDPYALRHTFASFAIASKLPTFELARFMGTSVKQIDETYGHVRGGGTDVAGHVRKSD